MEQLLELSRILEPIVMNAAALVMIPLTIFLIVGVIWHDAAERKARKARKTYDYKAGRHYGN